MKIDFKKIAAAYGGLRRSSRIALMVMAGVLVYGAVAIGAGQYVLEDATMQLRRLRGQVQATLAEVERLRADVAFVKENTPRYEAVLARGMFADRNRLAARRAIEGAVLGNRLEGSISLQPETRRQPDNGEIGQFRVVETPVTVTASGALDADLFRFARDVTTALPGFLVLHGVRFTRVPEVTADHLTALRNGLPAPLVTGSFRYAWRAAGRPGDEAATGSEEGQ